MDRVRKLSLSIKRSVIDKTIRENSELTNDQEKDDTSEMKHRKYQYLEQNNNGLIIRYTGRFGVNIFSLPIISILYWQHILMYYIMPKRVLTEIWTFLAYKFISYLYFVYSTTSTATVIQIMEMFRRLNPKYSYDI